MTDTPTPVPAASERMTAAEIAEMREEFDNRRFQHHGDDRTKALFEHIQSLERELAEAKRKPEKVFSEEAMLGMRVPAHLRGRALSPQPDRAKADEEVKEAVTYLQSWATIQDSSGLDDVARRTREVANLIRTLSARAEAAEARANEQAEELARVNHELTRLQLLERILQTPLDGLIPKIAAAEARLEDRELLLKEVERRCENAIAGREALRARAEAAERELAEAKTANVSLTDRLQAAESEHPVNLYKARADLWERRAEAAEAECARLTSELAGITDRIMERITNAHDQGYREATHAAEARAETARLRAHTLHVTGQEFYSSIEHLLDWMNGNDSVADYADQNPSMFKRQSEALESFRDALNDATNKATPMSEAGPRPAPMAEGER